MNYNITAFNKIITDLPEEVQFYYDREWLSGHCMSLADQYGLNFEDIFNILVSFTVSGFKSSMEQIITDNNINVPAKANKNQLVVDLYGRLFLPIDKYLEDVSIKQAIVDRNGSVAPYQSYVDDLDLAIEEYKLEMIRLVEKRHKELVDPREEKEQIVGLFGYGLKKMLKDASDIEMIDYIALHYLLQDSNFSKQLSGAILENQEKIGDQTITVQDKRVEPTISNWLADFIFSYGSEPFDRQKFSQYLVDSNNVKTLNRDDKEVLLKLLIVYHIIKFFPQYFANIPEGDWSIFGSSRREKEKKEKFVPAVELPTEADGKDWQYLSSFDVKQMSPIELRAFMEENDLSPDDINKLRQL